MSEVTPTENPPGADESAQPQESTDASQPRPLAERRQILSRHIQMAVAAGGRVESQSDDNAVIVKGKDVNHVLHVLISIFTCGLWLIVWLILIITGGEKRQLITVDEWGNVAVQKV
jgi:hypothetical protein